MATANMERSYWRMDPSWWRFNEEGHYELTDKAPKRAVESFKKFCTPRKEIQCPFTDLAPIE